MEISRRSWSASPQPSSQDAAGQMLVIGQGPRPAPPATPSPSACRSGRRKPPACPWGPGIAAGSNDLQRNHHAVRIGFHRDLVRLADVDQQIAPLRHPLRHVFRRQIVHLMVRHAISSRQPACEGSDQPRQSGAKVAPRATKIKRRERFKRPPKPRCGPCAFILLAAAVFRREVLSPWARRLPAFADRSPCSRDEGRNRGRLSLPQHAPTGIPGSRISPSSLSSNAGTNALPGKFGRRVQPLQHCRREWHPIRPPCRPVRQPIFPARAAFAPFRRA